MIKITTWNVNSVRKRLGLVQRAAAEIKPDILCLQETKVDDPLFPAMDCLGIGYPHQGIHGQKGYNGVAVLSKFPITAEKTHRWAGLDHCRHLSVVVEPPGREPLYVDSLYVPAGGDKPNPETNPKFADKLLFLKELQAFWSGNKMALSNRVVTGDFNIAPLIEDVWSHERLKNIVTHTAREREILIALEKTGGWIDAVRYLRPPPEKLYTWWSYRTPDWMAANKGRRLDHIWVSKDLIGQVTAAEIYTEARGWPEPSDHVPVSVNIE